MEIHRIKKSDKNQGFTLIEVMLALAILSLALVALLKTMRLDVHYVYSLEERNTAQQIALSQLRRLQLTSLRAGELPASHEETITMLNTSWHWRADIVPSKIAGLNEIELSVWKLAAPQHRTKLIGFSRAAR